MDAIVPLSEIPGPRQKNLLKKGKPHHVSSSDIRSQTSISRQEMASDLRISLHLTSERSHMKVRVSFDLPARSRVEDDGLNLDSYDDDSGTVIDEAYGICRRLWESGGGLSPVDKPGDTVQRYRTPLATLSSGKCYVRRKSSSAQLEYEARHC